MTRSLSLLLVTLVFSSVVATGCGDDDSVGGGTGGGTGGGSGGGTGGGSGGGTGGGTGDGGASDGGIDGGGGDAGPEVDSWVHDGITYVETPIAANVGFDPRITGKNRRTAQLPAAHLELEHSFDPSQNEFVTTLAANLFTGGAASLVGTYTFSYSAQTAGLAQFSVLEVVDSNVVFECYASGGTLTVADDADGITRGTYSVSGWTQSTGTSCPSSPVTGSFRVTRGADDVYGNDGTQADSFSIAPTTWTEGSVDLYDPYVEAHHAGSSQALVVNAREGLDPSTNALPTRQLLVTIPSSNLSNTTGGTFDTGAVVGATTTSVRYMTSSPGICYATAAGDGSIVVDPYGAVGSKVGLVVTIAKWTSVTGTCPSVPFVIDVSATREADGYY